MGEEPDAVALLQASIDTAEVLLSYAQFERALQTRLRDAVTSARADLASLLTACEQQTAGGASLHACMAAPSSAVETAGRDLASSLDAIVPILASRRIIPPEDPDKAQRCKPQPACPHRGGDEHHDRCADREPPNVFPGCDVLVSGKYFDALSTKHALWEVKTDAWSRYSRFLRHVTYSAHIAEAYLEKAIATSCEHKFVFAVADAELYDLLSEQLKGFVDVVHVPRCKR